MQVRDIVQTLIIIIISIWLHEYAHAYVSYSLWDPTPKIQKRLSPNPLRHLDPIGSIMMIIVIISWRWVGRWKPVQINPMYYKNPRKGEFLVAIAWPCTNLILATIGILLSIVYTKVTGNSLNTILTTTNDVFILFRIKFALINIWLALFNLIPIPPLDWFSIIKLVAHKRTHYIERYSSYITIWFLILILWPWRNLIWNGLYNVTIHIFTFIFSIFWNVFY